MSSDYSGFSYAELKEQLARQELPALRESGLLDPDTIRLLESYCEHYESYSEPHYETGEPAEEPHETERYQRIVRRNLGENLSKAVKNEEWGRVKHATGISKSNKVVDVEDWQRYERFRDLFRQEPKYSDFTNKVFQGFLMSSNVPPTGRGKSSTMYGMAEDIQDIYPNIRIVSNNPADPFEDIPEHWDDIEELIRSHDGWMLLLLDEVSQFLMYADQKAGKSVSNMLKLLRHNDTHLIGVAHTGADIPKDIRRQVFIIDKIDRKTAVVGYGIRQQKNSDLMEVAEEQLRLESVPHTNIDYGGKGVETIEVQFGERKPAESGEVDTDQEKVDSYKVEAVVDYLQSDDGLRVVADRHDTTHETLRKWVKEYTSEE